MSDADHDPTNLVASDTHPEALDYILGAAFHQPMKLIRQRGMEFGAKLSTHINPRPNGVEKLSGNTLLRIREGDFRIIFEVDDESKTVVITKVGDRKEVYEKP